MQLPRPTDRLANCVWFPRILWKARSLKAGALPPAYEVRFCAADGVDGQFITFFGLSKDDIIAAGELSDEAAVAWLLGREGVSEARIEEWNHTATNLGRPGFPLEARLPLAKSTVYKHIDSPELTSIFQLIEADER